MDSAKTTVPVRGSRRRRLAVALLLISLALLAMLPLAGPLRRESGAARFASLQQGMKIAEAFSTLLPGKPLPWKTGPGIETFAPHMASIAYWEDPWLPANIAHLTFDDDGRLEKKELVTPTYRQTWIYWYANALVFFGLAK